MVKDTERMMDCIMYVTSLSLSAFRFAKGQDPFDFESLPVAEFIAARALPFIEDEECDYRKAHLDFIQYLVEKGWKHGQEDFINRKHPDIVSWGNLSRQSQEMYGYFAGVVSSAKNFYQSLKNDLEEEFMSSFSSMVIKEKAFTGLKGSGATH